MSKGEKWTVTLGIIGVVGVGLQVWIALLHEEEHRPGIMTTVAIVLLGLLVAAVNIYAIYRNLKDAKRAAELRAEIVTIKDEHATQIAGLEKQRSGLEEQYKEELRQARQQHANNEAGLMKAKEDYRREAQSATDRAGLLQQELTAKDSQLSSLVKDIAEKEILRNSQVAVDEKESPPSRLVIDSATYGAIEGDGVDYPVEDFLNQIAGPNSLAFEIQNSKFKVNGWDYVPEDPKDFKEKRLKLTYSYDGGPSRTIRRRERGWLVLPEDPYIKGFPLLRLDVLDARNKLERFFKDQRKRILDEQVSDAGRAAALLYSATPDSDPYLAVEYERSMKSEMVDIYQRLKIYGVRVRDNELNQLVRSLEKPVYHANCRDAIKDMMEILWQIAPKITEEDDESTRVPGRPGRKRKL
jgi:hypothetical protein